MKIWLSIIAITVTATSLSWAGYRNVSPEERMESPSSRRVEIQDPSKWTAAVKRENGDRVELRNLGNRFASTELSRGEQVEIVLVIPGAAEGTEVRLQATHGGRVDEKDRTVLRIQKAGTVVIPFEMGTIGAHPLHVRVRGMAVGMMFMIEERHSPRSGVRAGREVRQ